MSPEFQKLTKASSGVIMEIEKQKNEPERRSAVVFVKQKAADFLRSTGLIEQYNLKDGQVVINLSGGGVTQVEVTKKQKRVIFR